MTGVKIFNFKQLASCAVLALAWCFSAGIWYPFLVYAETVYVEPKGEAANIDTQLVNATIETLFEGTEEERHIVIADIQNDPGRYAPPALYTLAQLLFVSGQKDEAAFWFYAGQLRAMVDANICTDKTARSAIAEMNSIIGAELNQYTTQDLSKLDKLMHRVVEWDQKTPVQYDRRWINLHGLAVMRAGLTEPEDSVEEAPLSAPEDEWDGIGERTREKYLESFKRYLSSQNYKE